MSFQIERLHAENFEMDDAYGEPDVLPIFGLRLSQVTLSQAADLIAAAAKARRRGFVVTPNVNMLTLLPFEHDLAELCNRALYQIVDGWPIVWASRHLHAQGLPERVAGSDVFPLICERAEQQGLTLALMGAAPGVADEAARRLQAASLALTVRRWKRNFPNRVTQICSPSAIKPIQTFY